MFRVSSAPRARRRAILALGTLIGTALFGAMPAVAHHAFAAEYDAEKPVDLSGTVTQAKWVNPHSRLFVAVRNPDNSVTIWGFEFGAPNALAGRGLTKADLRPGTEVSIKGYRSKNGGAFGYAVTLTLADGRTFQTGGAPDSPPPGGPSNSGQKAASAAGQ